MAILAASDVERVRGLHEAFGPYRYSEVCLGAGISNAAEQIALILWFVRSRLLTSEPPVGADCAWLAAEFAAAIRCPGATEEAVDYADQNFRRCYDLWRLPVECGEVLNLRCGPAAYKAVRARLRSRGFSLDLTEFGDLICQFTYQRLPKAIRTFNPARGRMAEVQWLALVCLRWTLGILIEDRSLRSHINLWDYWRADSPGEVGPSLAADGVNLESAIDMLPRKVRIALEMYFGLDGVRERTISETARQLDVSDYLARRLVVKGIAVLAYRSGLGAFTSEELRYIRYAFIDGADHQQLVRRLKLPAATVKTMSRQVLAKVELGLRTRTTALKP